MGHPMDDTPIAVRLANEGVPVRAIARATLIPSSDIWVQLEEAKVTGTLLSMPDADWPSTYRPPVLNRQTQALILQQLQRLFTLTMAEASILLLLLRRSEVPYPDFPVSPNAVRVFVYRLRARLKPFNMSIKTLHGFGFYLPPVQQKRALELLQGRT